MPPDSTDGYTITLRDVAQDLNTKLDKTTTDLNTKLDQNTAAINQVNLTLARFEPLLNQAADHEARLRILERFRFTLLGAASVIGLVSGALSDIIYHAVVHH